MSKQTNLKAKIGRLRRQVRNRNKILKVLQVLATLVEFAELLEHGQEALAVTFEGISRQRVVQLKHELDAKVVELIGLLNGENERREL